MKLSDWLAEAAISDIDFAATIGVTRQAVARYKTNQRTPRPSVLTRIRTATGGRVSAEDFLPPIAGEPVSEQAPA